MKDMKEERHDLITIGELSRLTGVGAKSLRYYERIGILSPAYVNRENGYRYYAHSQIMLVSAAQFYVEMGIPLSEIHHYINPETGTINCREQISYGLETARQKLRLIQQQIDYACQLLAEIQRSDHVSAAEKPVFLELPEKICVSVPTGAIHTKQKYYSMLHRLLLDAKQAGFQIGCESGLCFCRRQNLWDCSVFVEVVHEWSGHGLSDFSLLRITAGRYQCQKTEFVDISSLSLTDAVFDGRMPETILLSELFTSCFDYQQPKFELRWQVPG